MDIQALLNAISTVGFPIVCCGAMFWSLNKTSEQHREEMTKVTDALNNNTIAIQRLSDKLEGN